MAEEKAFYLAFYLFLAVYVTGVELVAHLIAKMTLHEFLLVFGWVYGVLFFTFSLIFVVEDDKKEQKKRINPWGVYHKQNEV